MHRFKIESGKVNVAGLGLRKSNGDHDKQDKERQGLWDSFMESFEEEGKEEGKGLEQFGFFMIDLGTVCLGGWVAVMLFLDVVKMRQMVVP
eukprot:CAMPEP_0181315942 /NCGR_PEP_ID=MMETSP1101-20121128/15636_1 /TAXON_ID=46948 /ORGANISM="Rhodomonas abbreviata, Strain Caron Lab Isolate" /LENGTH=90 /DNA_ID=CAMNT_0023423167 /DNA_START=262 /DNA_END=534 /DNA_ORIENTATION=+